MSEYFTRVTISGAIPLDTVSRNGTAYSPEAVKNALSRMDKLPVVDLTGETEKVVGIVDGNAYDVEESNGEISYKLDAALFTPYTGGRIFDELALSVQVEQRDGNKITEARILSVGAMQK